MHFGMSDVSIRVIKVKVISLRRIFKAELFFQ